MHQEIERSQCLFAEESNVRRLFSKRELDGVLIREKTYTDVSVDQNMVVLKFDGDIYKRFGV
jgi:hypothetical protein